MVPAPWFLEAVELLRKNPGLDAGVHLVLTSEWANYKWRPVTPARTFVDPDGYFFPFVWPNRTYGPGHSLVEAKPSLAEVEAEFRAQIEIARRHLPRVSFLSAHMGCVSATPDIQALTVRLSREYGLPFYDRLPGVKQIQASYQSLDAGEIKAAKLASQLRALEPGDYVLIDHAAFDDSEARAIGHLGYEQVAADRSANVFAWTHPEVMKAVAEKNIQLVTIKQLAAGSR
jgi:predicted glycoside hydrolase/deacetylase ChbG (UPF0249 family)